MPSPDFGNAVPLGPYVPCKRHCLGDYVNQHSPMHHPLETHYDQTNVFQQNSPNSDTSENSFLLYNKFSYLNFFRHESPEFYLSVKKVDTLKCQLSYLKLPNLARTSYG
jgi:hypothetical protein